MAERARQAGFTLVEVLVALVAASAMLAVIMNGSVLARQRAKSAEIRAQRAALAEPLLAAEAAAPYAGSTRRGEEDGLAWTLSETTIASDPGRRFILARIVLAFDASPRVPAIAFETRRLKAAPQR